MLLSELVIATDPREVPKVNYLKDRIQPFYILQMPDRQEMQTIDGFTKSVRVPGKKIEFSLGIFLLSTPSRTLSNGQTVRDIEAYDGTIILQEHQIDDRLSLKLGETYYSFILKCLKAAGIKKYNIEQSTKMATVAIEWEPGTSYLTIINDCLSSLNFTPIHFDENGFATARLYRSPQERAADVDYKTDEYSIVYDGIEEELDTMGVANKFVAVLNDPERPSLRSVVENTNPLSPTSYPSRGRWITDFRTVEDIADQESLNAYTERIAFEASQIYGHLSFETATIPFHGYADVITLENEDLTITGNYSETKWTIPLKVGAAMKHEARRVVDISGREGAY